MKSLRWFPNLPVALAMLVMLLAGCGTTKWSDTPRTATEQLLISDAVDRAISEIDFSALADKEVYLDTRYIITAVDQNYVVSTLRQHMLASGLIIKDKPDEATYVVEVRTGSLGTNRQDLLFGVPATNLPTAGALGVGSAAIPEIALMKRTNQQAVCKLAVFAYDRMSGRPVWQSGNRKVASRAKDTWVMGAGPFQRGTIYDGTAFAGERLSVPLMGTKKAEPAPTSVAGERRFLDPQAKDASGVANAGYVGPATGGAPATPASATAPATSQPLPPAVAPQAAPAPPATPNAAPPAAAATPPAANAGAAPSAPADKGAPASAPPPATPPKPAYTPPPAPVTPPPPPQPTPGLQGNLTPQPNFTPAANPAVTTAGAIQTFNLAKGLLGD